MLKLKIRDLDAFGGVFGADSFIEQFPELFTDGVPVQQAGNNFYIIRDGKPISDCHFFSREEIESSMDWC